MDDDIVILPPADAPGRRFPWWIPLALGVILIAVGVGLLIWPFIAATWLLAALFGSLLIANGIALLLRSRPSGASIAGGLVLAIVGVVAIVFPEVTAQALVAFFGVVLIVLGAFGIIVAARFGGLAVVPAVFALLGGIAALVWPQFALTVVAVVCGVIAVFIGAWVVAFAIRVRGLRMPPGFSGPRR